MSGHNYRVTLALPAGRKGTVIVAAVDREQAKARALNQVRSMGYDDVDEHDVMLCRKDDPRTGGGNGPASPIGGKPS